MDNEDDTVSSQVKNQIPKGRTFAWKLKTFETGVTVYVRCLPPAESIISVGDNKETANE